MRPDAKKYATVDEYISEFPASTKSMLKEMRKAIKESAPDAEEIISYNMPAYKLHGVLVYFAGYAKHIGFYPTGSAIVTFQKQLSPYKGAKGSVQFPLDQTLPVALISKMVKWRRKENLEKASLKSLASQSKLKSKKLVK